MFSATNGIVKIGAFSQENVNKAPVTMSHCHKVRRSFYDILVPGYDKYNCLDF